MKSLTQGKYAYANRKLIVIIYSSPEMCNMYFKLELKHLK